MYIKQKQQRKKNKKVIGIIATAILLGLIFIIILIQVNNKPQEQNTTNSDSNQTTQEVQKDQITQQDENTSTNDPKDVKQYEGDDPNQSSSLTGNITSAFIANGKFSLRISIDQYVSEGGMCSLTMTKGSSSFSKTAPLITEASTSTCQGFDASEAEVSSGTWHVKIELKSNSGKTGTIESEVNL